MIFLLHKMLTLGHLQTSLHGSLLIAFFIFISFYSMPSAFSNGFLMSSIVPNPEKEVVFSPFGA